MNQSGTKKPELDCPTEGCNAEKVVGQINERLESGDSRFDVIERRIESMENHLSIMATNTTSMTETFNKFMEMLMKIIGQSWSIIKWLIFCIILMAGYKLIFADSIMKAIPTADPTGIIGTLQAIQFIM